MRILNQLLNTFQDFDIFNSCILLGYRGSQAHGTYVKNTDPHSIDDIDLIGISVPPIDYYFGLKKFEQFDSMLDPWDVVIYEIKKYFSLMLKCNPNTMALLWLENDMYIHKTELGQRLIDNRNIFNSKQIYKSFCGYANGQLKRMTRFECHGYMGQKRKKLVEKYGFDCKNASHLIRLLEMGIEFIETGELLVKRPNADYLLDIKRGKYTLEQIQSKSDALFKQIHNSYEKSSLPEKPDRKKANKLLVEIIQEINNNGRNCL